MKNLIILISTALLSVVPAYAQSVDTTAKFGVQVAPALLENLCHVYYSPKEEVEKNKIAYLSTKIFGELLFKDTIGTQVSLAYAKAPREEKSKYMHSVLLQVALRGYLEDKLCVFVAPRAAWEFDPVTYKKKTDLLSPMIEVIFGCSYEWDNGLLVALEYEAGLSEKPANPHKAFLGSLYVGYNFASLF